VGKVSSTKLGSAARLVVRRSGSPRPLVPAMRRRIRILLADDDRAQVEMLRMYFAFDGRFEVVGHARDGGDAIRMTERLAPDQLLLDLRMPVVGGAAVAEHVKRNQPGVKVVIYSAYSDLDMTDGMPRLNADATIVKGSLTPRQLADQLAVVASGR
jgi:DNA-binding NarL/FixJ family response regulator